MRTSARLLCLALSLPVLSAGGCAPPVSSETAPRIGGGKADGPGTGRLPGKVQTIFVIVMENHNWSDIVGSAKAPFINETLLPMAAHAEAYYNPPGNHPSETNYIWMEAGDNLGITNDKDPSANHRDTKDHLVRQLEEAGLTWRSYQEDIDGQSCPLTGHKMYKPKHNPMVYFDDITDSNSSTSEKCIEHVRPYEELAQDLESGNVANYNFITPNLCHDMHGSVGVGFLGLISFKCLTGLIRKGDDWLSEAVPQIMASKAYQDGGALFVTWDESRGAFVAPGGTPDGDEVEADDVDADDRHFEKDVPIGMMLLSPFAKPGYANSIRYTHSSLLRTVQELAGVGPLLRDAANATSLSDLFDSYL